MAFLNLVSTPASLKHNAWFSQPERGVAFCETMPQAFAKSRRVSEDRWNYLLAATCCCNFANANYQNGLKTLL